MYHQIVVTLTKIASQASACTRRGLMLHKELQFQIANESITCRRNELHTHFMKKWSGRCLSSERTVGKPVTGSTAWNKPVSMYNSNGLFGLNTTGLGVGTSRLLPKAYFLAVPCRTLNTVGGSNLEKSVVRWKKSPGFFARIVNKMFGTSSGAAAARPAFPPERLHALLKGLPPSQVNAVIGFFDGYIAASATPVSQQNKTHGRLQTLLQLLVIVILVGLLFPLTETMRGDAKNPIGEVQPKAIGVTFNDVKGVDEAKSELRDAVEFLRSPQKFAQLGAKLPKGILLFGQPGTGKTLLARAVDGEAGVPFFHMNGSQFENGTVGEGARRIRDLFKAAKAKAPCVIFIDEIDSIGRKRTDSPSHPHANQTVNQLLCEMDGFHKNDGVVVLAATNRLESLDEAFLRPGRFDVAVQVPVPALNGRKAILEYYLGKVKRGNDVDVESLARRTIGFSAALLANLVNQATLKASVEGAQAVFRRHLEFACDKITLGVERKSVIQDKQSLWITACHESGHVLVAHFTKYANPVHKVTIASRGNSLGHTSYMPKENQYIQMRVQLMATLDTKLGGRAAEELMFGSEMVSSGVESDLQEATAIATNMVKRWGMSEKFGHRAVGNELSPSMAELIENETNKLLQESYERAKKVLREHPRELKALAEALMKYETLDADAIKEVLTQAVPEEAENVAIREQALEQLSSSPRLSSSGTTDSS